MKNKLLLLGGSGQLGTQIQARWGDWQIDAPSHSSLDLENSEALAAAVAASAPTFVLNCAAFHNVDRCEDEPGRAFALNAIAVDRIASICAAAKTHFITISTDYVFEGSAKTPYLEDGIPRPINTYGVSKFAGELLALRHGGAALVVRTCGLYGLMPSSVKGYTFIDRILTQARSGEKLRVVDDVVASPSYAADVADGLLAAAHARMTGTLHLANQGPVSWYEFATTVLSCAGVSGEIAAVKASDWKTKARRPAFSALGSSRSVEMNFSMPSWREGIENYLKAKAVLP